MNHEFFPFIPKNIVLRRYDAIDLLNLDTNEDFTIDEEAYELLKKVNGKIRIVDIVKKYNDTEGKKVLEALEFFEEEGIIKLSDTEIIDKTVNSLNHLHLPEKNPFDPPYLKFLMINITEKCNLNCKHCYITDKNQVDFSFDKLKELIEEFYNLQGEKIVLTGGEPFLYEKLEELLEFLIDIPLKKVLLTNGVLIEKKKHLLDLIKENNFEVFVSIDGLEDTHNDFRNANCFNNSIHGIQLMLKKNITVSINTMVHKQNLKEFDELSAFLKSFSSIKTWNVEVPTFDDSTPQNILEKYDISPEEGGIIMRDYWWGESYDSSGASFGTLSEDESTEDLLTEDQGKPMGYACGPFLMAIDVLGQVSKCGFFTEKSPGNVFDLGIKKSWEGIQKNSVWNIQDLKCSEINCDVIEECRGGCRYRALKHTKDLYGVDAFKCIAYNKNHTKLI
ncbi:MAG: radical SAM protein [Promethearchaeota archaeon]|nr:MAG: radical SAM protein [Candidatus Lokiarchaeota archaeon]